MHPPARNPLHPGRTSAVSGEACLGGCLKTVRSGESPGHGRDHGEVDHGFVVVGSGFVVAHAAAVLVDPRETSLDHPNAGPDVEPVAPGMCLMICIVRVRTSFAQMSNLPG